MNFFSLLALFSRSGYTAWKSASVPVALTAKCLLNSSKGVARAVPQ